MLISLPAQYKSEQAAFSKFFLKNGLLIKGRSMLSNIFLNINYLLYNSDILNNSSFNQTKWLLSDILDKKLNALHVYKSIVDLIKPPFVVKSELVPKKLRKKSKVKYIVKIVFKNEEKRIKSSYKQLYHHSNKFFDNKLNVRLFKSVVSTLSEWKNSYLYKLKVTVFTKYFKF